MRTKDHIFSRKGGTEFPLVTAELANYLDILDYRTLSKLVQDWQILSNLHLGVIILYYYSCA